MGTLSENLEEAFVESSLAGLCMPFPLAEKNERGGNIKKLMKAAIFPKIAVALGVLASNGRGMWACGLQLLGLQLQLFR